MTQHYSFLYDFRPPVAWHSVAVTIPQGMLPGEFAAQAAGQVRRHARDAWSWCFAEHSWRSSELLLHFASDIDATQMRLRFSGALPDLYS